MPILAAKYSSFKGIEDLLSSESDAEETPKQEKGIVHKRAHKKDSHSNRVKLHPTSPDESHAQTRQFRGSVQKSYSIEESSCENGTVYLPENAELGSLTTLGLQQPFVIAMVGLPARGKSHILKMMIRYLRWTGFEAQVFNVGSYRREVGGLSGITSDFFSNNNTDAKQLREEMAGEVQNIMYRWLHIVEVGKKGRVAIFDATNTTVTGAKPCATAREVRMWGFCSWRAFVTM